MISAGYEDGNDASNLRGDLMFKMALDLSPSDRELCSQSTISRLENLPDARTLLRMGRAMVDLYCESFRQVPKRITLDIDDMFDAVHGGQQLRKPPLPPSTVQRVVDLAVGPPPGESTHWTGRELAKAARVSLRSVQRILEAHQLAPHRIRTFKLSKDPEFVEKLRDIVGLYVDPPAHAVVLSVDEKSQIQALDRTPPGLPMKKGRAGTMTHDDKRHGTTTLFAALNVLDGTVIGRNMQRYRHQEFIRFLNTAEAQVPVRMAIHAVVDNSATHKHPKVQKWLARHPRWTFHFTPTSASWLDAVEGFFAKLTRRRLKRGVFRSVADLQAAINRFVEETNSDPKPFVWTADAKRVLAAVKRGKEKLESIHWY
jgi:transposase